MPATLKRLKRQKDAGARRRMHIEVATLQTLDHPGLVQFVESNAHEFQTESDLYLVTCRVIGTDLERTVTGDGPINVKHAVEILDPVLNTLSFCHSQRVIHRDIKPCHVILSDGSRSHPVLIDFGLSFNEDIESGDSTPSHIGVGNRFIGLPEQQSGSNDKRDARSDVTQCVGVLFFLVTGETPGFIHDSTERKPHERLDLTTAVPGITAQDANGLRRIFDIGFEYDLRRRWQSVTSLRQELLRLLDDNACQPITLETRLDGLSSRLAKSPAVIEQARLLTVEAELKQRLAEVGRETHGRLDEHVLVQPSASGRIIPRPGEYPLILGFMITTRAGNQQIHLNHTCHPVAGEIELRRNDSITKASFFNPDLHSTEVLRVGLFDPEAAARITNAVESSLIDAIASVFDNNS